VQLDTTFDQTIALRKSNRASCFSLNVLINVIILCSIINLEDMGNIFIRTTYIIAYGIMQIGIINSGDSLVSSFKG